MKKIVLPVDERTVRSLKAGDAVSLSGVVTTGRDKFHKWFAEHPGNALEGAGGAFAGGALYHCGPVITGAPGAWRVAAAGPTTSARENPYEPGFIARSGVRMIIGKGGMDAATLEAMKRHGCVYIQATGGAAAIYASAVERVEGVDFLDEFGPAEACWRLRVRDFPGIVAMDASGRSLFDAVAAASRAALAGMLGG